MNLIIKTISAAALCISSAFMADAMVPKVFECGDMKTTIDLETGALISLENKITGWNVVVPNAGKNFVMNLKDHDGNGRWVEGMSQKAPECIESGDSLTFIWRDIVADGMKRGSGVDFIGTIKFSEQDGLVYGGRVENHGTCEVETLAWPYIGRLAVPDRNDKLRFGTITYSRMNVNEIYPDLNFTRANSNLPEQAFALIGNSKQGLYAASYDMEVTQYIQYQCSSYASCKYLSGLGKLDSKTAEASRDSGLEYDVRTNRRIYLCPDEDLDRLHLQSELIQEHGIREQIYTRHGKQHGFRLLIVLNG